MNNALIENWNNTVGINDEIYHLGDFAFCRDIRPYLSRLNGKIYIIKDAEHHDRNWIKAVNRGEYTLHGAYHKAEFIQPMHILKYKEHDLKIVLNHFPLASWNSSFHGGYHFFAHCHGNYNHPGKAWDVGIDANNYFPISIAEAIEKINKKIRNQTSI